MKANAPVIRLVCVILFGLYAADIHPTAAASPSTSTTASGLSASVIRMATSQDGLFFEESGDILLTNAVNPSLIRLPDGSILAMFKISDASDKKTSSGSLAVSRTLDEGRSWSRPRKVRLQSRDNRPIEPGYVSMISTPQNHLKLYFIADAQSSKQSTGSSRHKTAILSAVSRNGQDFIIDPSTIVPITKPGRFIQTACDWNHHVYLYVSPDCSSDSMKERKESAVLSLTSPDGRKFKEAKTVGLDEVQSFHCALNGGVYLRAFVSTPEGICSVISKDANRWTPERGIRFKQGWNPAVIQRKDKSYLMLYCTKPDESTRGKAGLAMAGSSSNDGQSLDQGDWKPFTDTPLQDSLDSDEGSASSEIAQADPSGSAGGETNNSPSPDNLNPATAGTEDFFAPLPDFANRVDYLQWFLQQVPQDCSDNAYNAYASFMPMRVNDPNNATWPATINDMFNGNYSGPIQPWNPQEHPEWETTHQTIANLLAQFRDATRHDGYAEPIQFGETPMVPGDERLLGEILLPSLAKHRTMVKATLSDAWRAEGGTVSPERMTDAIETCLRNSSHLNQSFTLIHQLVSIAESNMVENNALKALQHNVFTTPDQLERTLNTLQLYDHFDPSPDRWLKCESGSAMQIFQQMYKSNSPGETPQLNVNRYTSLAPLLGQAGNMDVSDEEAAILKAQDPRQAVQQMKENYQQISELWKTGYPLVRTSDFSNGVEKKIAESGHPLVRMFMPSFSRAYHQTARNEASRRATQLSYSVHLFKARNGRWPNSLDELPPEHGQVMKIDPFSGGYFNYRMTDNGPTIYTSSENGRDDGGVHSPKWADNAQEGQSDDFVFWPPQK